MDKAHLYAIITAKDMDYDSLWKLYNKQRKRIQELEDELKQQAKDAYRDGWTDALLARNMTINEIELENNWLESITAEALGEGEDG